MLLPVETLDNERSIKATKPAIEPPSPFTRISRAIFRVDMLSTGRLVLSSLEQDLKSSSSSSSDEGELRTKCNERATSFVAGINRQNEGALCKQKAVDVMSGIWALPSLQAEDHDLQRADNLRSKGGMSLPQAILCHLRETVNAHTPRISPNFSTVIWFIASYPPYPARSVVIRHHTSNLRFLVGPRTKAVVKHPNGTRSHRQPPRQDAGDVAKPVIRYLRRRENG